MSTTVEVYGLDDFNRLLERVQQLYRSPRMFAPKLSEWWHKEQQKTWSSKGSYIGHNWKPNTPGWKAMKARYGYSQEPNELSGQTKEAMTLGRGLSEYISDSNPFFEVVMPKYRRSMRKMTGRLGTIRRKMKFYNRKHKTVHPYYFIDALRPIQNATLKGAQWESLNRLLQTLIDNLDRRL